MYFIRFQLECISRKNKIEHHSLLFLLLRPAMVMHFVIIKQLSKYLLNIFCFKFA
jgi:hypothetical protein